MSYNFQEEELLEVVEKTTDLNDLMIFNDDINTFEHVTQTLIKVCEHTTEQAAVHLVDSLQRKMLCKEGRLFHAQTDEASHMRSWGRCTHFIILHSHSFTASRCTNILQNI